MKTRFTFIFAFLLVTVLANAQTAKWCIRPEYAKISWFGDDAYGFECKDRTGKIHLFDWDGNELLKGADADSVTGFLNGYAIVLNGEKIVGFMADKDHQFTAVKGEYYMAKYSFFSEGLVVVADSQGKKGYLDTKGNLVIPCKFEDARPFMQGYASVEMAKKKVYYINPQGKTRNPEGFHGGKLTKGSSFNEDGEAVVANYQDYAVIGTNMQVKRKINYTADFPVRPCDYAYSEGDKDGCREAGSAIPLAGDDCEVYSSDGIYGYKWKNGNDDAVIPAQFSEAQPFRNGRAVVAKAGKYGVIASVEGAFSANWPKELRVYPGGKSNRLQFALEVPASLERDQVKLEFDEGDGIYKKEIPLDYGFQPAVLKGAKHCSLRGRAVCDGLLLWEGAEDLKINYISIEMKSPYVTAEFADENDNQTVEAVITNTSSVSVLVEVTLKVAGQTAPFKGTLKPKQSQALSVTVKVTKSKQVPASVSVKADGHDCGSKTSEVSLKI